MGHDMSVRLWKRLWDPTGPHFFRGYVLALLPTAAPAVRGGRRWSRARPATRAMPAARRGSRPRRRRPAERPAGGRRTPRARRGRRAPRQSIGRRARRGTSASPRRSPGRGLGGRVCAARPRRGFGFGCDVPCSSSRTSPAQPPGAYTRVRRTSGASVCPFWRFDLLGGWGSLGVAVDRWHACAESRDLRDSRDVVSCALCSRVCALPEGREWMRGSTRRAASLTSRRDSPAFGFSSGPVVRSRARRLSRPRESTSGRKGGVACAHARARSVTGSSPVARTSPRSPAESGLRGSAAIVLQLGSVVRKRAAARARTLGV